MNISSTGILLETDLPVVQDQLLQIDLGAAGCQEATVRWVDGRLLGCQFSEPLAKSRVSAALLQGEHSQPARSGEAENASLPQTPASAQRDFGFAVAWARKVKGVNQAELARAIGVSTTTICKWERGHATPRAGTLARLQEFLQDAETSAAQLARSQPGSTGSEGLNIPHMISEFRTKLADHLGLKREAIEVQFTIKDLTGQRHDGDRP